MNLSSMTKANRWEPMPAAIACYVGTHSRTMRMNQRIRVDAEACGRRFIVTPLELVNGRARVIGAARVILRDNIQPIQPDLFCRARRPRPHR
jgi:hypothetical protein